ncbi:TraB/GumN family protein [Ilyomonas limi]|uniref:TraB/GumN family protein n=1 Tax=Ilyomonas limi TaxID=2575867 RepID=A0A4U3KZJ9_9BACT|nr:TraB/GumN family protein [Ilyomonas limi]TKK67960.1 TraB/GumN family protein [Ilyomonas limi]
MRKVHIIVAFVALFFGNFLFAQQLPSTLLWKISGNGLQKPSYLYGTMHLTDERIFNLGDSLYKAIENTEGFAIEINPDDFTPFIIDEAKKSILASQRLKDMMSDKEFKKYAKVLAKKFNKDEDDITTADVLKEKNKWIEESYKTGKMQTFLDAYLFDVARRQGKWTGGVEDMQDQENLINYAVDESDIEELAVNDGKSGGKAKATSGTEQLINFYVKNDLNAIERLSYFDDSAYRDKLLTVRNRKMAMRMDSLSHERSMVFAVGAAHLPGSDGLIALLTKKGFMVTPVFSSKKIKPAAYKVPEIALPWYDVKDEAGLYVASMPGKAGNMTLYGIMNMKMYFDVFNSTMYMTTALQTPYSKEMADSVMGVMASYYFGTSDYNKGKPVTVSNVSGREFILDKDKYSRGYLLYKDGVMYMAIAVAMKKDTAVANAINQFLHSYVITENNNKTDDTKYITYTNAEKAYSIDVPAQPKSTDDLASASDDKSISRDLKTVVDPKSGDYLFFGVNEAAPGFFIPNDSVMLASMKESQKDKFSKLSIDTTYFKDGHRVMEMGGMLVQAPVMMKARYEFRGNRWYALVAMYDPKKDNPVVDRFFGSFKMLDYTVPEWKQYTTGDTLFSTWAPGEFTTDDVSDSSDINTTYKYESFDKFRADGYTVTTEPFSKYYWQKDDTTLLKKLGHTNIHYNDTILSEKFISNGGVRGMEMVVQQEGAANVRRKRLLLNDNKLYNLVTIQPLSEIYNNNTNKFFEDFRFAKAAPNDQLFNSKATLLLHDLSSKDSATRATAKDFLNTVPFSKEELPLLHEALLKQYADDEEGYGTTKEALQRAIINMDDSSSYYFAKDHYLSAAENDKNVLLGILLHFPTKEHYQDIKTALLQQPPKQQPDYSFVSAFTDSLQLTASIFADLLPLLDDTVMAPSILRIARPLLDSGLMDITVTEPYQQSILRFAQQHYKNIKSDPDSYDYSDYALLDVLGYINNTATNAALQSWTLLKKSPYLQMSAACKLLHNKQVLNPSTLQNLAAEKGTRTALYDTLRAYKKEALYPKAYLTQKDFAESYVYTAASDDDEPSNLTYLTQKVINFKGKEARFYFYKVTYGEEDDASYSLACAGPFNVNANTISAEDATGEMYYEEDFDPTNLPAQMDALIKQMEDWYGWGKKNGE